MSAAVRRSLASLFVVAVACAASLPARGDDKPASVALGALGAAVSPVIGPGPGTSPSTAPPAPNLTGASGITITLDDGKTVACQEQTVQPFLVRGNWFPKTADADKQKEARKLLEQSIKYRTTTYGYFEGFGQPSWNPHPPKFYAKPTTFMGLTVQVHEKIIPALKCVEAALKASNAAAEYHPHAAGRIRFKNTYRGFEVSNHVYGIAIDIEPDKNTCCGCVAPWPDHPLCKDKSKTVWQRMAMPKSWVDVFERFGFYWLGHDVLQDTMHFEFLGDPDKVVAPSAQTTTAASL